MKTLVTTANGMFGGEVVRKLAERGAQVRAMVRDRSKFTFQHPCVDVVSADLDVFSTIERALDGVGRVFLATPMHPGLAERECAVIDAAKRTGVKQIVKIHGAVKHEGDHLNAMHQRVLDHLGQSGVSWCLVSPNSVMETSLLGFAGSIREEAAIYGMSGHGKIGLVALEDVAEVTAHVLTTDGHDGHNYELTGPQALSLYEVAEAFGRVLDEPVTYHDMPEEEMRALLAEVFPMSDEDLEINVLCHLRCWRDGKADLVTDTFKRLTGKEPTSLEQWIDTYRSQFKK